MESTVGAVEGRHYKDGECVLENGSMLIWDMIRNTSCELSP